MDAKGWNVNLHPDTNDPEVNIQSVEPSVRGNPRAFNYLLISSVPVPWNPDKRSQLQDNTENRTRLERACFVTYIGPFSLGLESWRYVQTVPDVL